MIAPRRIHRSLGDNQRALDNRRVGGLETNGVCYIRPVYAADHVVKLSSGQVSPRITRALLESLFARGSEEIGERVRRRIYLSRGAAVCGRSERSDARAIPSGRALRSARVPLLLGTISNWPRATIGAERARGTHTRARLRVYAHACRKRRTTSSELLSRRNASRDDSPKLHRMCDDRREDPRDACARLRPFLSSPSDMLNVSLKF